MQKRRSAIGEYLGIETDPKSFSIDAGISCSGNERRSLAIANDHPQIPSIAGIAIRSENGSLHGDFLSVWGESAPEARGGFRCGLLAAILDVGDGLTTVGAFPGMRIPVHWDIGSEIHRYLAKDTRVVEVGNPFVRW